MVGAQLTGAHMTGAHMNGADLQIAQLDGADVSGGAELEGANLHGAHLDGADLGGASLIGANLTGAHVAKARLAHANLKNAIYAPTSEPPDPYVARIEGLDTLNLAPNEEVGLVQLRKLLQDAGLRDDERRASYSIQRSVTSDQFRSPFWSLGWCWGLVRFVGFDVTTAYGLYPWHALIEIIGLGVLLTSYYFWEIRLVPRDPGEGGGIYQVFPADRVIEASGGPTFEKNAKVVRVVAEEPWEGLRKAVWFSLLSAVNIGFEQFNPGDWIRRLQSREYSLQAVGRVRIVAGAQALISVYLLAIWALTQFGRPFD
jgi:hypothetical protein